MKLANIALPIILFGAATAWAGPVEQAIVRKITPVLGAIKVESVSPSPMKGIYEVVTPRGIVYTDANAQQVLLGGAMIDSATRLNLTEARWDQLGSFVFSKLPFEDALKTVRGNGSRNLVTFEDPNCGYCKKLSHELEKLQDVTVYTFLVPILGEDSLEKSKSIWCADDRSSVYSRYMLSGDQLPISKVCQTPITKNLELRAKLRISGTPALLFEDNSKVPGYIPASEIEKRLSPSAKP